MKNLKFVLMIFAMVLIMAVGGISASAETVSGICGESLTWSFNTNTGVLQLEGTGDIPDYDEWEGISAPWSEYSSSIKTIQLPEGLTGIGIAAFNHCSALTSVNIPKSVSKIGYGNFGDSTNLTIENYSNVYIPSSSYPGHTTIVNWHVNEITGTCGENLSFVFSTDTHTLTITGTGAMYDYDLDENEYSTAPWSAYCDTIQNIVLPNGLTNIGNYAFAEMGTEPSSIIIPSTVTIIGEGAFYSSSLFPAELPNGLKIIGKLAFDSCVMSEIVIPESVESIGTAAFGRSSISNIEFLCSISEISNSMFFDTPLESFIVPDGVTHIGENAFFMCSISSISIPNSVKTIGYGAFGSCWNLEAITIPNSLTTIGEYAFWECSSLESITIPASVTSIGSYAFEGCEMLSEIDVYSNNVSIGESAFGYCDNLKTINNYTDLVFTKGSEEHGGIALNAETINNFAPPVTTPEVTTPEATTPEATTPEATTPEATTPEATTPEATTPEVTTPEATTPPDTSKDDNTSAEPDDTSDTTTDNNQGGDISTPPEKGEDIIIDLINTNNPKIAFETLKELADSEENVQIMLTDATIHFDSTAISAIASQSLSDGIIIKVNKVGMEALTEAQKESIKGEKIAAIVSIEMVSGGSKISDFGEGTATVSIPFSISEGKSANIYYVAYIDEDGKITAMPTSYSDGMLTFETPHFSEYAVIEKSAAQTSDYFFQILAFSIAVTALIGTAVAEVIKKRRAA